MNTFQPELTIHAVDAGTERTYRFAFYLPRGDNYVARCKSPSLVARVDDSLAVLVDRVENTREYSVAVGVERDNAVRVELARITVNSDEALQDGFDLDLLDAVQHAVFKAMGSLVPTVAVALSASVMPQDGLARGVDTQGSGGTAGMVPAAGWRSRVQFTKRNVAMASVLVVGFAFAAYGAYGTYINKTRGGITADVVGTPDYADLQEKIRKQITEAAKSGTPATAGENMDNVAIATMRAMGLDPGKANAGCLVGVKE